MNGQLQFAVIRKEADTLLRLPPEQLRAYIEANYPEQSFPGRNMLTRQEVANALQCSLSHINAILEDGELGAANLGRKERRHWRVPVMSYYRYFAKTLVDR